MEKNLGLVIANIQKALYHLIILYNKLVELNQLMKMSLGQLLRIMQIKLIEQFWFAIKICHWVNFNNSNKLTIILRKKKIDIALKKIWLLLVSLVSKIHSEIPLLIQSFKLRQQVLRLSCALVTILILLLLFQRMQELLLKKILMQVQNGQEWQVNNSEKL